MTDDPTARIQALRDDLLLDVPPHGRQRVDNHTLNSWLTADESGVMPISAGKAIIRDLLVTREIAALLGDVALAAAEFAELVDEDVLEWETQRGSDAARARLHATLAALEERR